MHIHPPQLPAEFWLSDHMQEALASWHMGRVIAAYRSHPSHGRLLSQGVVAGWIGITQAQLSRIEHGTALKDLDKLVHWARTLGIPAELLWFSLPEPDDHHRAVPSPGGLRTLVPCRTSSDDVPEADDMHRRELLRILSMAGPLMAASETPSVLSGDVTASQAARHVRLDPEVVNEYAALNSHLWRVFGLSRSKRRTFPLVREQLDVLIEALGEPHDSATHRRLCRLAGDLFQLAGEILFDADRYTEAAHCYTLAASASKEADDFDLWACALTRHAFISVYEQRFAAAAPMLQLAAGLALRGDSSLSTRYWINAVQAETFAGLGDLDACQQALDRAERVGDLGVDMHNGGWLRFDGSRLAEERGTCYVTLEQPDLAEAALGHALNQNLSARRRGSVLTDLAALGLQRRELSELVVYANAALELAEETHSGVIARKLHGFQRQLIPHLAERKVRHVHSRITALAGSAI